MVRPTLRDAQCPQLQPRSDALYVQKSAHYSIKQITWVVARLFCSLDFQPQTRSYFSNLFRISFFYWILKISISFDSILLCLYWNTYLCLIYVGPTLCSADKENSFMPLCIIRLFSSFQLLSLSIAPVTIPSLRIDFSATSSILPSGTSPPGASDFSGN